MRWSIGLVVGCLVACHHGDAAPGASCAHVGDHLLTALEQQAGTLAGSLRDAIVAHCTQDGWSGSARACVSHAATRGEAEQCDTRWFTHDQHTALAAALIAIITPPKPTPTP